jgi:predicted glycoside hydrolase/deacetylase ChbG (UPF0249 family)
MLLTVSFFAPCKGFVPLFCKLSEGSFRMQILEQKATEETERTQSSAIGRRRPSSLCSLCFLLFNKALVAANGRTVRFAHLLLVAAIASIASSAIAADADGKRYVIIHADDAGMSHSVNRATIAAMEDGIVSSASIMVPCPWFKEFAAYAKAHPEKDFGIHLALNSEWTNYRWGPVAGRDRVPSLVDKEGYLWDNVAEVAANAKAAEVEIELAAQIQRALDFGVPLTHLDTHMGALVCRPDLVEAYVNVGVKFNLPVFFLRNAASEVPDERVRARAQQLIAKLEEHNLPVLDHMTQLYTNGSFEDKRAQYLKAVADSKPGVHYLILHCGYDDHELRAITSSSKLRDTDRRVFTDPEFIKAVKATGVQIVTWKQVREMNAKRAGAKR